MPEENPQTKPTTSPMPVAAMPPASAPQATPPGASETGPHPTPPAPPKKKKAEGVLVKKPGQWVCLVKNEKGKNCEGKLKRYYDLDPELIRQYGRGVEIYRCVECHTLYRPENPGHDPAARWAEV